MIYRIVDLDGDVLGEFEDYESAAEWLQHVNNQSGPVAHLTFVSE